jgi:spermidine/putrescine transport system permease protein
MRRRCGYFYTLPVSVWITVFFVIPTAVIFLFSFMQKGLRGGVISQFSLEAYRSLFHPAFVNVVGRTVYISIMATLLTLAVAIPASYYIARSRHKNMLLLLIIVPFWTNLLIRIFAWISILGNNGFLNAILVSTGLVSDHIQLLYNTNAVILVTVYTSLPYAMLPLYSTIEKFDFSLLEAARDLGATKSQSMIKVFLPGIKAGIITAVIFTFIPALGSYAIPQLVGGTDSYMIGNIIARELTTNRNWPLASSMSVMLTMITTIGILIFVRLNKQSSKIGSVPDEIPGAGGSDGR